MSNCQEQISDRRRSVRPLISRSRLGSHKKDDKNIVVDISSNDVSKFQILLVYNKKDDKNISISTFTIKDKYHI